MIIVPLILNDQKTVLEVIFTPEEKEDPLFEPVKQSLEKADREIETLEDSIIITENFEKGESRHSALGKLVDEVREKYVGDIVFEVEKVEERTVTDPNTKKKVVTEEVVYKEKDYSNIPRFTLGRVRDEAVREEIPEEDLGGKEDERQ